MNEQRFTGKGMVYNKARPSYPETLFEYLRFVNVIKSDYTAADIGAGTGIFSRQLAETVSHVYAVEPNDDMRNVAQTNSKSYGNISYIPAAAESTTLSDGSVDVVTVAQAFHWFDRAAFKQECRRIIKPGGKVVLVWNDRDKSSGINAENLEINRKYCNGFKGSSNGMDFRKENFTDFFDGNFEIKTFENNVKYDSDTFMLRNLSSSFALKPEDEKYPEYIDQLQRLFGKYSSNGLAYLPYITRCYIGRV